MKYLRPTYS